MKTEIIKTKAVKNEKNWHPAYAARDIAKKIWGDLKVADSFLYLYRRFGCPTFDTNDEYKISYDYRFIYKGLYFCVTGTTPDFVYLDCYYPSKYFLLQRNRYRKDVRAIFEAAAKEGILVYPWAAYEDIMPSLTKQQQKKFRTMFMDELTGYLGEDNSKFMGSINKESSKEDKDKSITLHEKLWEYLADKFWKWVGDNESVKGMFKGNPDFRYLPEVEKIVTEFCNEMLQTKPIRDCDINIQGWK